MGFRNGCYASVWGITPSESGKYTDVRISISKKRQDTQEYVQDFSGNVRFIGDANEMIQPYVGMKVGEDRKPIVKLRLENVESTVTKVKKYDGTDAWYHGYQCYSALLADEAQASAPASPASAQAPAPYNPSIPDDVNEEELPFN